MSQETSLVATPAKRAVIVVGVQNEYFNGRLALPRHVSQQALGNILRIMGMAKEKKIPIIAVQNESSDNSQTFVEGSHGWKLHESIEKFSIDHHIRNRLPSAFAGTELTDVLRHYEADTITLVGFVAQRGIIATAIEGRCLGFSVEFASDASASLSQLNSGGKASGGEIHRAMMVTMQASFAATMNTDRWIDMVLSGKKAKRAGLYASYDCMVNMD